jgi:hypothetical protein
MRRIATFKFVLKEDSVEGRAVAVNRRGTQYVVQSAKEVCGKRGTPERRETISKLVKELAPGRL